MTACLASASVRDLCMLGDRRLTEETSKAFKKDKKITKVDIINIIQPSYVTFFRVSRSPRVCQ